MAPLHRCIPGRGVGGLTVEGTVWLPADQPVVRLLSPCSPLDLLFLDPEVVSINIIQEPKAMTVQSLMLFAHQKPSIDNALHDAL